MLAAMGLVKEIALELRADETHETLSRYPYSFGEAQALFPSARA
jgi:hypothetical protein